MECGGSDTKGMTDWLFCPQCKSKKKSGGKKMASKFQPVKAEEEHQAAGESSTERTPGKENKRKRSMKDDKGKRSSSPSNPIS